MENNSFLGIFGIIILVIISGCATYEVGEVKISLQDLLADREVYHSSDVMNMTAIIYSYSPLKNVTVNVIGINGRLNEKKVVELESGINEVFFDYKLPRCNVCGGIRAGDYEITCEVNYQDIKATKSTKINIQQ